jgi:hypothetical protein
VVPVWYTAAHITSVYERSIHKPGICRTLRSGGTRIRTGDTMIFRHMRKPLGMRQILVGKPIYVRRVPVHTTWFYPYCCATVDTACVIRETHDAYVHLAG